MDDLLREFLTETSESLDTVDNQLVRFEQEPNNAKILDNIFEGEGLSFRVTANGLNARLPQNIADILSSEQPPASDAHSVQPYYTRLLAQSCGLKVSLAPEGEAVVVSAS